MSDTILNPSKPVALLFGDSRIPTHSCQSSDIAQMVQLDMDSRKFNFSPELSAESLVVNSGSEKVHIDFGGSRHMDATLIEPPGIPVSFFAQHASNLIAAIKKAVIKGERQGGYFKIYAWTMVCLESSTFYDLRRFVLANQSVLLDKAATDVERWTEAMSVIKRHPNIA